SVSIALQYGVPLRAMIDKFVNARFEPSGFTGNKEIPYAKSIIDYIGRWLGGKFISRDYLVQNGETADEPSAAKVPVSLAAASAVATAEEKFRPRAAIDDAPSCSECGMLMTPNGSCYKCENCGSTSGCS
ncbi:MAG TPA: hypothetical protein VGR84_06730, partial [Candidatus Acidoferrales bacterium]|nr:hypothetical protein [Candidatus Acidoferrales bacterium]